MEKRGLQGQRENSQHKRIRDFEDRVQRPNLHLNRVIKRKKKGRGKQMFKGKMDDNFSESLKDSTSQVKKQTQCKKKFTNRQYHSETEKHRRK